MNPRISIIIPHHNRPKMLTDLVRSIPDRSEIETIVIDDHSNLEFPDLSFRQNPVRIEHLPSEERFAGSARNLGIDKARGSWILFADSDDIFSSATLDRLVDLLDTIDTDIALFHVSSFRDDGSTSQRHFRINGLLQEIASGSTAALVLFYPPWSKLIRKSLIEQHNLKFESVRVSNDVMFAAKLSLAAQSITVFQDTLYNVREGHQSLTSTPTPETIGTRLNVLDRYNRLLKANSLGSFTVPAAGQLRKIFRTHPIMTIMLALRARYCGTPILLAPRTVRKLLGRPNVNAECKMRHLSD